MKIAPDRRQGDVDNRGIQRGDPRAEHGDGQHPAPWCRGEREAGCICCSHVARSVSWGPYRTAWQPWSAACLADEAEANGTATDIYLKVKLALGKAGQGIARCMDVWAGHIEGRVDEQAPRTTSRCPLPPPEWSNHDRSSAPHRLRRPPSARRGHSRDDVHHRP